MIIFLILYIPTLVIMTIIARFIRKNILHGDFIRWVIFSFIPVLNVIVLGISIVMFIVKFLYENSIGQKIFDFIYGKDE